MEHHVLLHFLQVPAEEEVDRHLGDVVQLRVSQRHLIGVSPIRVVSELGHGLRELGGAQVSPNF